LEVGKTTNSQILEIYGSPQKEGLSGNFLNWCYIYHTFGGKSQILFVQFDSSNILKKKAFNDSIAIAECGDLLKKGN
jgi:hypothetical protein